MEALLVALGELIAVSIAAVFGLLLQVFFLVLSLTAAALSGGSRPAPAPVTGNESAAVTFRSRRKIRLNRAARAVAGLAILTLVAAAILNFLFFEWTVRAGLARLGERTGSEIEVRASAGNFFSGRIELTDVTAVRRESDSSTFELRADAVRLRISPLSLLTSAPRFEEVAVEGLQGTVRHKRPVERLNLRHSYEIDHLRLARSRVVVRDESGPKPFEFRLGLDELESRPLRSNWAPFDLLFRSHIRGTIDDRPFAVGTEVDAQGCRSTRWEARDLTADFLGRYLGGPFQWLAAGTVDVRVFDRWKQVEGQPPGEIEMQWRFVGKNLQVRDLPGAAPFSRTIAAQVRERLAKTPEVIHIDFDLSIDENKFSAGASADAAGLWDAVGTGLVRALAAEGDQPAADAVRFGFDHLRRLFDIVKPKP